PIDGAWDDPVNPLLPDGLTEGESAVLQHVGVRHPDYLMLRALPDSAEVEGWSTALSVQTSYFGDPPDVRFAKEVDATVIAERFLCVDPETYQRHVLPTDDCETSHVVSDFLFRVETVIDYGFDVRDAADADIDVTAAYPFGGDVAPDQVEYRWYGAEWVADPGRGVLEAQLN
ncbi:MAG: hypothetical protein R3246_14980, partial [Acidimicrobiia bacterium]|nr:hypothetical protein [Acidimicrobiia bacterium]